MKRAVEIIDRKKAEKEAAAQAKREEVSGFYSRKIPLLARERCSQRSSATPSRKFSDSNY
jgi:hypothetical protein